METSPSIAEITKALCAVQSEIKGAVKDSDNPFFRSKYADLASVWEACRVPLNKHGLAVFQSIDGDSTGVLVTTMLAHISGEWVRDRAYASPKDMTPQSVGSATTYLRRYGLAAIVGVVQVDDDAESSQPRGNGARVGDKHGPRPDLSAVNADEVENIVSDVADTVAAGGDVAAGIRKIHSALVSNSELYIRVGDVVAERGILSKAKWKEYVRSHA